MPPSRLTHVKKHAFTHVSAAGMPNLCSSIVYFLAPLGSMHLHNTFSTHECHFSLFYCILLPKNSIDKYYTTFFTWLDAQIKADQNVWKLTQPGVKFLRRQLSRLYDHLFVFLSFFLLAKPTKNSLQTKSWFSVSLVSFNSVPLYTVDGRLLTMFWWTRELFRIFPIGSSVRSIWFLRWGPSFF